MNDDRMTEQLVARVLGWRLAPGRFIKPDRGWTPSWQFNPFTKLADAFLLLDNTGAAYSLTAVTGRFAGEVRVGESVGRAICRTAPRAMTLALIAALKLEPPQ